MKIKKRSHPEFYPLDKLRKVIYVQPWLLGRRYEAVLKSKQQKRSPRNLIQDEKGQNKIYIFNEIFLMRLYSLFFANVAGMVLFQSKIKKAEALRKIKEWKLSQSTPQNSFLNLCHPLSFQILRTLPLSRSSWHLLRQSGLLVNSTKAFSAWSRVVVSVVSYSCLHRFSSWARLWKRSVKKEISPA